MIFIRPFAFAFSLLSVVHAAEPFRPGFHFTPDQNWINDPNGLVYADGEYHLFYQYNPFGDKWGHMSWGHAVSSDLVKWEQLPVAIPEKDGIMAFSGSAVIDHDNTSGFGTAEKPPMVAIYTGHREGHQSQRLAFSNDKGRTWSEYAGNPVLDVGKADFRDPKVFWHAPTKRWIMTVALSTEKKVSFYGSPDLKKWQHLSDFGPAGATGGIWECPDLFALPVEKSETEKRWVLLLNMNPGAPAGGSGCQYFVGNFDGKGFKLDSTYPTVGNSAPAKTRVLADFEGPDHGGWTANGIAFASGPDHPQPGAIPGTEGNGIANSFGGADAEQGTLVSPEFLVNTDWLSFRIGGGNRTGLLGMRLLVDAKEVRGATGGNGPEMELKSWDLRPFRGRKAVVEIFDRYSGGDWGHVTVDQIVLGNGAQPQGAEPALWVDYGSDCYAMVTWSDIPKSDGRRIGIGWMNNWAYTENTPTSPWRGAMTFPRVLGLRRTPDGIRLTQRPVAELAKAREGPARVFPGGSLAEARSWLEKQGPFSELLEMNLEFRNIRPESRFSIGLHTGPDEETRVGHEGGKLFVDRSRSGITDFSPKFAARHEAPVRVENGRLALRLFLDASSLEVFAAGGETAITDLIFPKQGQRRISIDSDGPGPDLEKIVIQPLKSVR